MGLEETIRVLSESCVANSKANMINSKVGISHSILIIILFLIMAGGTFVVSSKFHTLEQRVTTIEQGIK